MKTRELIAALTMADPSGEAEVVVTWETTRNTIDAESVYVSADGEVVVDGDGCYYKTEIAGRPAWLRE